MIVYLRSIKWPIEIISIIVMFSFINLTVLIIGYKGISTVIICQIINLLGFIILLSISIVHISNINNKTESSGFNFLKKKFHIVDILLVVAIIIFNDISFRLMTKVKFVEIFNISMFNGFTINNMSAIEKDMILMVFFFVVIVGVFAEELYFRAYLFEKQYKYFKNYTWIVNGFSWSIYHIFSPTNFIALLPSCLFYSYCYQKRRNVWITLLAHLISNCMVIYFRMKPLVL